MGNRLRAGRWNAALLLSAAFALAPLRLEGAVVVAQQPASQAASLRVRLRHQDSLSVVAAEVSVKNGKTEQVVRSDSTGVARVEGLAMGSVEIRVRRVGLKQVMLLARVEPGENEVTISLDGTSAMLDEMRIVGNRTVSGRHEDFEMRLKRNDASAVITRAQIEKRNPVALSTMLRGLPGLRIADSLGSKVAISSRGKVMNKNALVDCVMRTMVDGIVMPALTSIDNVYPREVYGIEVFNGAARIPVNMGGMRTDNWCGMIAIWTR